MCKHTYILYYSADSPSVKAWQSTSMDSPGGMGTQQVYEFDSQSDQAEGEQDSNSSSPTFTRNRTHNTQHANALSKDRTYDIQNENAPDMLIITDEAFGLEPEDRKRDASRGQTSVYEVEHAPSMRDMPAESESGSAYGGQTSG
jgi:hypothetical protein